MLKQLSVLKTLNNWSHFYVLLKNVFNLRSETSPDVVHMDAAVEWLCHAQDELDCGGVSAGYSMQNGWREAYPETTGYIIQTFLKYSRFVDDSNYLKRAIKMGDWEIKIQLSNGAVRGGVGHNKNPIVFNTGQVILGWVNLFEETGFDRFKQAAIRAADWLLKIQDEDGKWSKFVYLNIPHSYHTEVAWSILDVYKITQNENYLNAARKQIVWTLSNARENGWFEQAAFTKDRLPITHTIGYTLQGLLESAKYFEPGLKDNVEKIVHKACVNIMLKNKDGKNNKHNFIKKYLQASFDESWNSSDKYSCLTGSCQIAICILELNKIHKNTKLLNAALNTIEQIKSTQILKSKNKKIRGGIQGSYPIWGKYMPYFFPNWAAKYFVDVLMLKEKIGNNE
jgi:hypothetical protein